MTESEAILEYIQLRKQGKIRLVLVDMGKYYFCEEEIDPWGSKYLVDSSEFIELVLLSKLRKGVERECLMKVTVVPKYG